MADEPSAFYFVLSVLFYWTQINTGLHCIHLVEEGAANFLNHRGRENFTYLNIELKSTR